ncbi:MAG: hypothetical protein ACON5D_08200 [Rubripirellula sp.]
MKHHMQMFCILGIFLALGCKETTTQAPVLPRPEPDQNFDRISKIVVLNKSKALLENPQNDEAWKTYGDACLMNGWFSEASIAYRRAEELGSTEATMMKAHSLRQIDPERAFVVALGFFQDSNDPQAAATIASWHFEDGSLEEASTWLSKASSENSVRSQTLSIMIDVQREQFREAKEKLQKLIELSEQDSVQSVAAYVARATQDDSLLEMQGQPQMGNPIPVAPRLRRIAGLNRTEGADIRRTIRIRNQYKPQQALQKLTPILKQRPDQPFIQAIGADLLYKVGQLEAAAARLNRVRKYENSDYEFWLIDAAVHSEIYSGDPSMATALQQADVSVEKALLINPDIPEAHQIRAMVHELQSNLLKAQLSFKKASELSRNEPQRVKMLSESLRCMALSGEAIRALDELDILSRDYGENFPGPWIEAAVIAFQLDDQAKYRHYFDSLDADSKAKVEQRIGMKPAQE